MKNKGGINNMESLLDTMLHDYYKPKLMEFMHYHSTGEYQKLSDNPEYKEITAILESMNIIENYLEREITNLSKDIDIINKGY